jgi:hypothetical protein
MNTKSWNLTLTLTPEAAPVTLSGLSHDQAVRALQAMASGDSREIERLSGEIADSQMDLAA